MKKCNVVRDMIDLAFSVEVSEDTSKYIANHIAGCKKCRDYYEKAKEVYLNETLEESDQKDFKINEKVLTESLKTRGIRTIIKTIIVLCIIGILAMALSFGASSLFIYVFDNVMHIRPSFDDSLAVSLEDDYVRTTWDANKMIGNGSYVIQLEDDSGNVFNCIVIDIDTTFYRYHFERTSYGTSTIINGYESNDYPFFEKAFYLTGKPRNIYISTDQIKTINELKEVSMECDYMDKRTKK